MFMSRRCKYYYLPTSLKFLEKIKLEEHMKTWPEIKVKFSKMQGSFLRQRQTDLTYLEIVRCCRDLSANTEFGDIRSLQGSDNKERNEEE